MSDARKPRRVYVTVTLDCDADWYDGLDDERPQDDVAAIIHAALDSALAYEHGMNVVRVEASELPT